MSWLSKFLYELLPYTEALDVKDELLIYQYSSGKTKRIRVEKVISDNEFEFPWSGATTYDKYDIVSYNGDLWEAVLSGNTGHAPVEGQWWTKLNKVVGSTITKYVPGAYGKGIVIVHHPYTGAVAALAGVKLWELVVPEAERPFLSTDIEAEIAAGKWEAAHPVTAGGTAPDLTSYVAKNAAGTDIELTPSAPSMWGNILTGGKATLIAFINYIGTRLGQLGDKDLDTNSRVDQRILKYDSAQNKYVHVAANAHSHSADDITETTKMFISQAERDKLSKLSPTYEAPVQNTVELTALPQAQLIDRERRFVEDASHDFFYNAQAATQDEGYLAPDDQTGGVGYWVPLPTGGSETALSIANKYHSNENVEQFETLEKQKLGGIALEATKNVKVTEVDAEGVENDTDFLTVVKGLIFMAERAGNGLAWNDTTKELEINQNKVSLNKLDGSIAYYASLPEAYSDAVSGEVVVLNSNVILTETIALKENVILDVRSFTVTMASPTGGSVKMFSCSVNTKILGNGTLKKTDASTSGFVIDHTGGFLEVYPNIEGTPYNSISSASTSGVLTVYGNNVGGVKVLLSSTVNIYGNFSYLGTGYKIWLEDNARINFYGDVKVNSSQAFLIWGNASIYIGGVLDGRAATSGLLINFNGQGVNGTQTLEVGNVILLPESVSLAGLSGNPYEGTCNIISHLPFFTKAIIDPEINVTYLTTVDAGASGNIDREELEYTALAFAASITVSIAASIKHIKRTLSLTGNVTTLNCSSFKNGDRGSIYVAQDATGGRTIAKPAGHLGEFVINDGPNEVTELTFEHNGTNVVWRSAPVV